MKKLKLIAVIIFGLFTVSAFGQTKDTLIFKEGDILWRRYNSSISEEKGEKKYTINNKRVTKEYFVIVEKAQDSAWNAMALLGNPYFKYFSKKGKLIEEGFWSEGVRIRYRKNGKLKDKGNFNDAGLRIGKWYFYNRRGKLIHTQNFEKGC